MNAHHVIGRWRTVALTILAANAAPVAAWALCAPASFYRSFPGGGRSWISVEGPFNEHLVRDVGGLNLTLVVLTVAALWVRQPTVTRVAAMAWLPFAVPHAIYHLAHVGDLPSWFDKIAVSGSLAMTAVLALILAFSPSPARTSASGRPHLTLTRDGSSATKRTTNARSTIAPERASELADSAPSMCR